MTEPLTENEQRLIAVAEEATRKYTHVQQLLTSFLGNMPALSFIKDDEGRYLYASRSFAEFFDVAPEAFLGKTDFQWLPADVARQFVANDEIVRSSGEALEAIECVPKNGRIVESIVQKFPIWVAGGKHENERPFIGGIALDITDRRRAEEEVRDLAEELQSLAYTISHELQEPVNKIKSYQNLLAVRYRGRLGEDADTFIQHCSEAAITIEKMVNGLWTFARIEKDSSFKPVDSERALGAVIGNLSDLIAAKNVVINYDALPVVRASETQLTELFTELIRNSIAAADQPVIYISCERLGAFYEFCIADNGCGIDAMFLKDVFKLFRRSLTQRPDPTGAGMGLPICLRIVEHHGGTVRVDSSPESGTRFYFTLPTAD